MIQITPLKKREAESVVKALTIDALEFHLLLK